MATPPLRTQLSADQKDAMLVTLRRRGWTLDRIAKHMGMSHGGVHAALKRIAEGRPGKDERQ